MPSHNLAHLDGLAITRVAVGDTVVDYNGRSAVITDRQILPGAALRLQADNGRVTIDSPRNSRERTMRLAELQRAAPARPATSTPTKATLSTVGPRPTLAQLRAASG